LSLKVQPGHFRLPFMTHSTRRYLFRLGAAWVVLALTSCAHAAAPLSSLEQLDWSNPHPAARDPRTRSVALIVVNQCHDSLAIHVLRAGATPALLGSVAARQSRLFDVTHAAPIGSAVRFAGGRNGVPSFLSDEVRIRRPGTILVEIGPESLTRNASPCDAPGQKPSRRRSHVIM
jgi:hypothetical protein